MKGSLVTIDVGKDFTRFPAGRTSNDGPFSGEAFREIHLRPHLIADRNIVIRLDSALGYGSSFLEEAFGGLVRAGFEKDFLLKRISLETSDKLLKEEIEGYINGAKA